MTRMIRRRKTVKLAAYLLAGAFILQLGPFCSMAASQGLLSFDKSLLLGDDESLLGTGLFFPCGVPNTVLVDQNGNLIDGIIYGSADDLIYGCPITRETVNTPTTGG